MTLNLVVQAKRRAHAWEDLARRAYTFNTAKQPNWPNTKIAGPRCKFNTRQQEVFLQKLKQLVVLHQMERIEKSL